MHVQDAVQALADYVVYHFVAVSKSVAETANVLSNSAIAEAMILIRTPDYLLAIIESATCSMLHWKVSAARSAPSMMPIQ